MHGIVQIYRIVNFICRKILKMNWLRFLNVARTFPNGIFPNSELTYCTRCISTVYMPYLIIISSLVAEEYITGCVYKINRYLKVCKCLFLKFLLRDVRWHFARRPSLRNLIKHYNPSNNFSLRCLLPLIFYKCIHSYWDNIICF